MHGCVRLWDVRLEVRWERWVLEGTLRVGRGHRRRMLGLGLVLGRGLVHRWRDCRWGSKRLGGLRGRCGVGSLEHAL